MDLSERVREQKSVSGKNLETAAAFTKKDLPLDVSVINQNENENTEAWAASQTTTEFAQSTSLATTMQLDGTGKVNIFLIIKTKQAM